MFVLMCSALGEQGLAASPPISYDLRMSLNASHLALDADARVELTLEASDLAIGSCLYLPQLDPELEKSIAQLSIRAPVAQDRASRQSGSIKWDEEQGLEAISPAVFRVTRMSEARRITLRYALRLSAWRDRPANIRLLTQFYPQLLSRCPGEDEEVMSFAEREALFALELALPDDWKVMAPGRIDAGRYLYEGASFSLALYKEGQVHISTSPTGRLLTLSRSPYFEQLRPHAESAIRLFESLTGWRPEKDFLLIETEDYEPLRIPGLIVLNRPQQAGMRLLQEDFSNWSIWQLAQTIADQWFGIGIKAASLDDMWLTQGFADFLVVQFLDSELNLSNLFTGDAGEEAFLRMGYRQAQDLIASYLSISLPHNALVDGERRATSGEGRRPPYAYVRHAQALRYLHWLLGDPNFTDWLKALVQRFRGEPMRPSTVLVSLEQKQAAHRQRASIDLLAYWQSDSWPEMSIGSVEAEREGSRIEIKQNSPLRLVFDVAVKTKDGRRFQHEMAFDEEISSLYVPLPPQQIQSIEINPGRAIYDSNRFNNKDEWPKLALFPGDARTLADDAYTVLWIPYASKLPGQKFSLQLGWQMMRYIGSGLSGLVRYEPESGVRGFNLNYRLSLPDYAATLIFAIGENDGRVLAGERLWDLTLMRSPLLSRWSLFSGSTRVRMRQLLGQPERNHVTSAIHLKRHVPPTDTCGIGAEAEYEVSTWVPNGAFSYGRAYGVLAAGCDTPHLRVRSRWFIGSTHQRGLPPGGALFQVQNIEEAHIRLDRGGIPLVGRVRSLNLDLATPARLPLPDAAFVLPRRSLFKIYSDWGLLEQPDQKIQAAGVGVVVPFGGDVVGRSSVTLLQFSLYSVLYRRLDEEIDRSPGFIFDFTGDL